MRIQLLLVVFIAVAVSANEVCYGRLGCFADAPPYTCTPQRPISRSPWSPKKINTSFLLFTRDDPEHFQVINALNVSSVFDTKFSPRRKSCFIIHGFLVAKNESWLVKMCQTLLKVSDMNCFCVDWSGGSDALYTQAVHNVRLVGAEVAYFIDYLVDHFSYPPNNIHLIGHHLGAHVAGEAGKRRPGIARISGLDPAGPYFEHTPNEVRLDPSDASFVDIIHTDGSPTVLHLGLGGFGMSQMTGHLDFFPNGGKHMPGCPKFYLKLGDLDNVLEGIDEKIMCNNQRSITFFSESILNPYGFVGYQGPSFSAFQAGAGFPCCNGSCTMMGYYANSNIKDPSSQPFFLNIGGLENLQRWRYLVTVNITGSKVVIASLSVSLCGKMSCSPQYPIHSGLTYSGKSYSSFIDVEMDIYPIKVVFVWRTEALQILHPTLGVKALTVQYGPSGTIYHFCGNGAMPDKIEQTLDSCPM